MPLPAPTRDEPMPKDLAGNWPAICASTTVEPRLVEARPTGAAARSAAGIPARRLQANAFAILPRMARHERSGASPAQRQQVRQERFSRQPCHLAVSFFGVLCGSRCLHPDRMDGIAPVLAGKQAGGATRKTCGLTSGPSIRPTHPQRGGGRNRAHRIGLSSGL